MCSSRDVLRGDPEPAETTDALTASGIALSRLSANDSATAFSNGLASAIATFIAVNRTLRLEVAAGFGFSMAPRLSP